jgi:hypothetical protein
MWMLPVPESTASPEVQLIPEGKAADFSTNGVNINNEITIDKVTTELLIFITYPETIKLIRARSLATTVPKSKAPELPQDPLYLVQSFEPLTKEYV